MLRKRSAVSTVIAACNTIIKQISSLRLVSDVRRQEVIFREFPTANFSDKEDGYGA
jgi:hypothetical protein